MTKKTPHIASQEITFAPDFLHIPTIVGFDKDLQPLDKLVYSVVYWLERLRDGRCFASNKTIAKVVGSSSGGVANSLIRLRDKGYIACLYDDKGQRKEIKTLVYKAVNPSSNDEGGVHQMMNIESNTKRENTTSTLTKEQKDDIKKIYRNWLAYMIIDPEIRLHGSPNARKLAIEEASKRYKLTEKRRSAIATRLNDAGYEMLVRAIANLSRSPWHRDGENDRGWKADLAGFLCRSYEKVEEWANRAPGEGDNGYN